MARPRYHITDGDVHVVHRWVRGKLHDTTWPQHGAALTAWDMFPLDTPTATKLQRWCDRFLDAAQWKQLHAVIRAARRDKDQYRIVRLSTKAHETLQQLAKREKLTLSATLERYLSDAMKAPAVQATPTPMPSPKPRKQRKQSKEAWADDTVITPAPWAALPPTPSKVMQVKLWLRVENNSKFVRGKKKAREEIERSILRVYQMRKPKPDRGEYVLTIPYETDEELDRTIEDMLTEASHTADYRHCFIKADVQSLDDPDRSW